MLCRLVKSYVKFVSSFPSGIQWNAQTNRTEPLNPELHRCLNRCSLQDDVLTLRFPSLPPRLPNIPPGDLEDLLTNLSPCCSTHHWHSAICWRQIYKQFRLYHMLHIRKIKVLSWKYYHGKKIGAYIKLLSCLQLFIINVLIPKTWVRRLPLVYRTIFSCDFHKNLIMRLGVKRMTF